MKVIRVGTRKSRLAMKQTEMVVEKLKARWPKTKWEIVTIATLGDRDRKRPLHEFGGEGVFVKELEHALLDGRIDIAVHSFKDMPTAISEGLAIAAVPIRDDAREAMISRYSSFGELPTGSTVGSSSLRRRAQLLMLRGDLKVIPYRGNLDTRIRKIRSGEGPDAAIVAIAGILRLGLAGEITRIFDEHEFLPAAAQGAIAVEARAYDDEVLEIVGAIDNISARVETEAERDVLKRLGAGCRLPVGVRCFYRDRKLSLIAKVFHPDGKKVVSAEVSNFDGQPEVLGEIAAKRLIDGGALDIIAGRER